VERNFFSTISKRKEKKKMELIWGNRKGNSRSSEAG